MTFHEAYARTGRIVNITVSPASDYERPRLLNYLTAPNVLLWSAACASCAFPILFQPVELVAKDQARARAPRRMTRVLSVALYLSHTHTHTHTHTPTHTHTHVLYAVPYHLM